MADDLVTIATFMDATVAHLQRAKLEGAGIETFVAGEAMTTMAWHWGAAGGGLQLLVAGRDSERALEVLHAAEEAVEEEIELLSSPDFDAGEPAPDEDAPADEPDDAPESSRERDDRHALTAAIIGVGFFPFAFYALYLLGRVLWSEEPLRETLANRAWLAAAIDIPFLLVLAWFTRILLTQSS